MSEPHEAEPHEEEPHESEPHEEAKRAIEAVVMVSDEPVDPQLLGQLVELAPAVVEQLCADLAAEYLAEGRGFQLVRVAGGYRYQSHPDQAPYIERFVLDGQSARLSAAALETLAIVAYKQPISRAQVAAIRGVGVDGVMRTLQQRGYIEEIGRDTGPGQAVLFGTTQVFLERLGLDSLADLPPLGDFVPGADVVEALEHGLRAEPGPASDASDDDHPEDDVDGPATDELALGPDDDRPDDDRADDTPST
jgi:segregation and condensation protein B